MQKMSASPLLCHWKEQNDTVAWVKRGVRAQTYTATGDQRTHTYPEGGTQGERETQLEREREDASVNRRPGRRGGEPRGLAVVPGGRPPTPIERPRPDAVTTATAARGFLSKHVARPSTGVGQRSRSPNEAALASENARR